jgi:hypothetical protein
MKTTLKKIALAGALTGGLSMAALGLGAGVATADSGDIPFAPGGTGGGDWQSYFPMIERLGDMVGGANLGNLGKGNSAGTEGLGGLGNLGGLGSLANLGGLGNLGNGGNLSGLMGMFGG